MPRYYLGIDLGGTNVKAGITDNSGNLLNKLSMSTGITPRDLAARPVIQRMVAAANQVMAQSGIRRQDVAAVGVLSPGQPDLLRGIVLRSANLPLWKNVPLRADVSKALNLPAVLENDAKAAAYGEWWAGVGKNKKIDTLFMFTLGTGVGGGIIYKGRVLHGEFGFAAEVGHSIMIPDGEQCGCGQRGCLERYCSARFTAQRAMKQLAKSGTLRKASSLGKQYKEAGTINAADIEAHARAGDAFAREIWHETCRILALACINVCHFIDPQMIVLAGGMSKAGRFLLDDVRKYFHEEWWKMTKPHVQIAIAKLGNDAGVIGGAGVAKYAHDQKALPAIGT